MMKNLGEIDPVFANALRRELIEHVNARKRRRWLAPWLASVSAVVIVAGGGVATAAVLGLPGAPTLMPASEKVSVTGTGTATAELGSAPVDANYVTVRFECLTPGDFEISGVRVSCHEADVAQQSVFDIPSNYVREDQLEVLAGPGSSWQLTATYVVKSPTEWGRNIHGETFGVINDAGSPDLIAVEATNGKQGYVRAVDLNQANGDPTALNFTSPDDALRWQQEVAGTIVTLPVVESDGETRIGEFVIQR